MFTDKRRSSVMNRQMIFDYRKQRAEKKDLQHKEKMDLLKDIKTLLQNVIEKE